MKRTPSLLRTGLQQAALLIGLGLYPDLATAVTFTNTPAVVSNTYTGPITLQIGGLDNGESVVVQEFFDFNTNGVVDAGDWLVQQFRLTDGAAGLIGGIVNSNVPGDTTPTNGAITARLSFKGGNVMQSFAGKFLFALSSPTGHFTPITNSFTVTNLPYAQGFTGSVVSGGTNVPNAVVMLFSGPVFESSPLAAVVADNAGNYSVKAPSGTYGLAVVRSGYLQNTLTAPVVALGGTTIPTNLSLVAATSSLAGNVADAANPARGVPAVLVSAKSDSGYVGIAFTDTNGAFALGAVAGQWYPGPDDLSLVSHGYVGLRDRTNVSAGQTGITLAVPKGTALFYGSVKDPQGNPLGGIDVYAYDDQDVYETDGYSDANGNYCAAVVGGLSGDPWRLEVSSDDAPANYIFSLAPFDQSGGTNLAVGQAVRQDFVGAVATNQISGYLKDGGNNPITNIKVWAEATIGTAGFHTEMNTDAAGHYVLNVCNGMWSVGVLCGGGGDNSLGSQYLCPDSQNTNIANNNATVNFTALLAPSRIQGYVKDFSNTPIANVGVYAYMPGGGGGPGPSAVTDSSGYYSLNVANGTWNVDLICCGSQGLSPLGYQCVGEQSTSVTNGTNTVSFYAPQAPYQITGHLRDADGNPIANVGISCGGFPYQSCATTAGDGSYTLYVSSGVWWVTPDCSALGSLGYLCPGGQEVTISNVSAVLDITTVSAPYQITGWVRNTNGQPFTDLDVHAYTTIGTNSYWLDSWTDSDGNYAFQVADGTWSVGVDCGGLGGGYLCPNDVPITIAGASVVTNLTIQSCGALQILTTSLPDGQEGVSYDFYLQASSCYPSFSWYVTDGYLPPGLTLDHDTGEIFGTPTDTGTFFFTMQVTDGNDTAVEQPLELTISPAPADVVIYYAMKLELFRQLDPANLAPDTNRGPFMGKLSIVQSALDTVPIAEVILPGGAVRGLPLGSSGIELAAYDYYSSQAAFDADYTNGDYTFAMATAHNGFQFPVLMMPTAAYPAAQRVSNFAAAQAINPANPFTLQWSNPADATTNDTIWAFILDSNGNTVFTTPYPPTNHATCLKGTATSVVVPANTLQAGATYTGVIGFYRWTSLNTAAYPGAVGLTHVGVMTDFPMVVPGAALPVLSEPTRLSGTQFGFLLSGSAGQTYTILSSGNLSLPLSNWAPVLTTNLSDDSAFIVDNQATNHKHYYRVRVGP